MSTTSSDSAARTLGAPTAVQPTMKAVAVRPGEPNSIHLRDVPKPSLHDVPGQRGVLVRVLRVGVDGTDKEINAAEYGHAPSGDDYLILGHESFGVVEAVAPGVTELVPGDCVVATVRRPGSSPYDAIGLQDMTTDDTYYERGINLLHGFLAEYYSESADFLVKVPTVLRSVGVLMEPVSVAEKAIGQAFEIQRRLRIWQPKRALVLGTGTLGLLAAMILRLRGLEVLAMGRTPRPYLNADLLEQIRAGYMSTQDVSIAEASRTHGPFDLIIEGTGYSPLVFEAMDTLAKNGVLVLLSVTGGDRRTEIPADRINQGFVLGNKVLVGSVNASRADYMVGVSDLAQAELSHPGWLQKLLTHKVKGLESYRALMDALISGKDAIKVVCEVADLRAD
ncbi:MAG TPA: glucose 1-dehydrogenase [Gemmatimonadaceae bacterium]|nr:glucose 1-dehydrogenase [Gemmatimonadaceae bacterium]